jgi:hypothetical protein
MVACRSPKPLVSVRIWVPLHFSFKDKRRKISDVRKKIWDEKCKQIYLTFPILCLLSYIFCLYSFISFIYYLVPILPLSEYKIHVSNGQSQIVPQRKLQRTHARSELAYLGEFTTKYSCSACLNTCHRIFDFFDGFCIQSINEIFV